MHQTTMITGRILALSVAKPRSVMIHGREVSTAIVRSPSILPLEIIEGGVRGNQPAVHTEHLLAFPSEHYEYWSETFGVARDKWDWCWWGENLTVAGISEEELHIGDVIEIGTARFRVTSPRIPCFKVAWRVGQPESVLPTMMETGRVGFHLEVLKPGTVKISDIVRITTPDRNAITVAGLSRLLLSQSPDDLPLLTDTLELPALGLKARNAVRQRINLIEDTQRLQIGRWRGWRPFEVSTVTDEAEGIRSFHLKPSDNRPIAPPAPGQFLTIKGDRLGETAIVRPWTISGVDLDKNEYRITIRRIESGIGSAMMFETIKPGSKLHLRPPSGQFSFDRSGFRRVALISGGIGVTPMLAMLKSYVDMGNHAPPLLWVQVVRNGRVHAFRDEIQALLDKAPRSRRFIWYTNPDPEDGEGLDFDVEGRPTASQIEDIIRPKYAVNPFGKEVLIPGTETEIYICGPQGFQAMLRETLGQIGVRPELIKTEVFAPADAASSASIDTATVHFSRSGISAQWHADDGQSLLDLAESAGLDPPYACRSGVCQSCRCRIMEGQVEYTIHPGGSSEPGVTLLCCSRPASSVVNIDI